jgi:superfamily II DNA or RNA helicase
MEELWDHQNESLAALRQSVAQGVYRMVLQAPTGAGKTKIGAEIIKGAQRKNNRLAFVVSQISLIDQTLDTFAKEGITDIGVIQADHRLTDWSKPVQLCSVQTLQSREKYPECKTVIIDECHVLHQFHKKWLKDPEWQRVPFIGLSATPWTKGLGKFFDSLLVAATTQELIDKGLLSKFRVFATGHPDLTGVRTVLGDYHEGELSAAMQRGSLVADIVKTWKERWGKDKTFIFGVDCAHAQALQARFNEAGIKCAYQDARTTTLARREIKRQFHAGEIQAIANVGTLTIGVDYDVRCLVLARPTQSEMLYVQIVGRALRNAPGKDYAIILDHSDTTERLGFVTDIIHDHLDMGKPKEKPLLRKPLPRPCPQCECMLKRIDGKCQNCGHTLTPSVSGLVERDGELFEIVPGAKVKPMKAAKFTMDEKAVFLSGLKFYGIEKSYSPHWASQKYRAKFEVWPDPSIAGVAPRPPTMQVRQWIKSQMIAYAKGKRREAAQQRSPE